MSNFSSITGPAIVQTVNTQAVLGSPSSTLGSNGSALFNNSLSVTLPTGTTNDWNPPNFVPGVTNFLQITPVGTPTLNGINTSGMAPGFTFLLYNASSTGSITIGNLTGSQTQNQFSCPQATNGTLQPQAGALCTFTGTNIIFAG